MHSIQRNGRLVLMRISAPVTVAEMDDLVGQVRMNIIAAPAKVVFCADLTSADVLPPEAEAAILTTFTRDNPKLERSAIMVSRSKTGLALQMDRLVRDAKNPNRRVFDQPEAAARWLGELLTEAEQAALRAFLTPGPHSKPGVPQPVSRK